MTIKRLGYQDTSGVVKKLQKLLTRRSNNWFIMSFNHSGSEMSTYRVFSGSKLDGIASYMTA